MNRAETLTGRIVRFTPRTLKNMANPELAKRSRGLCTRLTDEGTIAWIVWDGTYAAVWELAANLEPEREYSL